ncbi:hypothetical protein NEMIN01_0173 [Nematocida minor]|uniref:uncharacterized protein n=1 Tax=Nematocida minor TaxID=1912983 RepID=UPI00222010B7|nr:uncharacterized protein NEMIN01_0069 [Nematocida minor]XP_051332075.1 uncharacterized protein NEMIN01_0173 [Nematocida minor]KAI5188805.1 hypothetical protein NEMIN01_0069 [Nematocida minor]KAI5188909.1 hypothetical protein NEMIN01_0173 [Nematocida minor]
MDSVKKEETPEGRKKESKAEKRAQSALKQSASTLSAPPLDHPLLNQMKTEIRRLYGEKVNMANTNYIVKPHEFKCLAKALSKALWNEEKTLETVDDIIYAVDYLCSKKQSAAEDGVDASVTNKELLTTIRFIASSLRALVPQVENRTTPANSLLSADLKYLMESKDVLETALTSTGHSTLESLAAERTRLKNIISSITQTFSISPAEDILASLKNMQKQEEKRYNNELLQRDRNAECQKRYFEETIQQAKERIAALESENKNLVRRLNERKDRTAEVLERGDALEQNISQIKQVLAEEETRIQQEREEYKKVKKTLIDYNKKMAKIVQELVERIKKEQKERDNLMALRDGMEDA